MLERVMTETELEKTKAKINKMLAEARKLVLEADKLGAEKTRLDAEARKMTREIFWYPIAIAIGMIGAVFTAMLLLPRLIK